MGPERNGVTVYGVVPPPEIAAVIRERVVAQNKAGEDVIVDLLRLALRCEAKHLTPAEDHVRTDR